VSISHELNELELTELDELELLNELELDDKEDELDDDEDELDKLELDSQHITPSAEYTSKSLTLVF